MRAALVAIALTNARRNKESADPVPGWVYAVALVAVFVLPLGFLAALAVLLD